MPFLQAIAAVLCFIAASSVAYGTSLITLGSAEAPLNGPWRFQMGDDLRWADPHWDDRSWELVDLKPSPDAHDPDVGLPGYVAGWMQRGHAGRYGYAWYRLRVRWKLTEPSSLALVGPAYVEDSYEVYWNGARLGGIGDFSRGAPRALPTRPLLLHIPEQSGSGEATIAVRVFLSPDMPRSGDAGGIHIAPILAAKSAGQARYAIQWMKTLAGYFVDAFEPFLFFLLALYVLSIGRNGQSRFMTFLALALVLTALLRVNQAIFFWGGFEDIRQFMIAKYVVLEPLVFLAWTITWSQWARPCRAIARYALVLAILMMIFALIGEQASTLRAITKIMYSLVLGAVCLRIWQRRDLRLLAILSLLLVAIGLFAEELWAIGLPGIWFPFGVGVSRTQFSYALLIPVLALLCHMDSRRAARSSAKFEN